MRNKANQISKFNTGLTVTKSVKTKKIEDVWISCVVTLR